VCPVKIPLHHQLLAFRSQLVDQKLVPAPKRWSMAVLSRIMQRPRLFAATGRLARWGLRWMPRFITHAWPNTWARQRDLPPPPTQSFRAWLAKRNDSRKD
jgi:L-lactate dehydrogenase complex protein LldF